jgi:PAS domain S-box-containing protein
MKRNLECQANLDHLSGFNKERLLTLLLNNSPDVVILLATDYTLRMVNQSFIRQTGLALSKVIGNSGLTLFPSLNKRLAYLLHKSRLNKQTVVSRANLQLTGGREAGATWQAIVYPLFTEETFEGWVLIFKKGEQLHGPSNLDPDSPDKTGLAQVLPVVNFDLSGQQQKREENWQIYQIERDFFNTIINHAEVGLAVYNGANLLLRWSNDNYQEFIEEAAYAQTIAGIQTKPGLPYVANSQLDRVASTVLRQKIPQTNILVEFQPPKQRERARWKVALVPLWASNVATPDILVITLNISIATGSESIRSKPGEEEHSLKLQSAEWKMVVDHLNEGLAELYNAPNMYELLKAALKSISRDLKADGGALGLFNRQGGQNEVYQVWHDEVITRQLNLSEQPHARLVWETQNPVYFTAEEAYDTEKDWFAANDVKSCLAVPLIAEEVNCIGILLLYFAASGRFGGTVDFDFVKTVAAKYTAVIGRAKNQLEQSRLLINERRARVRAECKAAKLSALLQSIREGINVIDASGNILLRNQMERRISRVPDEAAVTILNYGDYRLLWPDNTPVPVGQMPGNRLLRGEAIGDTEFVLEHSDGSCFNVICSGNVIRDEEGQLALGIIITRDITEMRQLEESREAFIRTVSHDLRNPLTVVSARSQLLQRRLVKHNLAVEAEEAQVIYISARRMTQMIQEMFDSYRLESNNLKLNKNVIDFAAVVKDLISRIGLEEELHRLQVDIAPGDYRIYADEERLERVVTNLIGNALKYSPNDRPVVVKLSVDAGQIMIAVTDFGMGIEPQDLPKVFQRYYRSKSVKEATGLGLGLYIVKLIVEAHNGKIEVESHVNEGSTFSVYLPILMEVGGKQSQGTVS